MANPFLNCPLETWKGIKNNCSKAHKKISFAFLYTFWASSMTQPTAVLVAPGVSSSFQ